MNVVTLAELFEFTPDDLEANRGGELSMGQRGWFDQRLSRSTSQVVRGEVVLPFILVIGILLICNQVAWIALQSLYYGLTGVLISIMFFGSLLILNHLWSIASPSGRKRRALMREDVQIGRVEAAVVRVASRDVFDENRHLEADVGDLRLQVRAVDNLPMQSRYIAYYLPQSKTLLSLEPHTKESMSPELGVSALIQ